MTRDFDEFFRTNYESVRRRLIATGAPHDEASEATQEAFVRAYARWPLISRYDDPAGWVFRVARNLTIDEHRRRLRDREIAPNLASSLPQESNDHATEMVEREELLNAIEGLPPQQRRAAEKFYLESKSTDESAAELGISAGAVRFHLTRARQSLRVRLLRSRNHD